MPEEDTPPLAPGSPRRPPLPPLPPLTREEQRARDRMTPVLAVMDADIAKLPAAVWDTKRWTGRFLDDRTSSATGEPCWARVEIRHFGEPRALIELRPGLHDGDRLRQEGPAPMWYVTIGRRQPRKYVFLDGALNYVMDRPARNWTEYAVVHEEWIANGDLRLLSRLYWIQLATGAA
jgi:hypothetical protein